MTDSRFTTNVRCPMLLWQYPPMLIPMLMWRASKSPLSPSRVTGDRDVIPADPDISDRDQLL